MFEQYPVPDCPKDDVWQTVDINQLPRDFRRMLSVQFREFVHHIEDIQAEVELEHNPRVVSFLERCYSDAA